MPASGSAQVSPSGTTTYTLSAQSSCGTDTAEVTVTLVSTPVVDSFASNLSSTCAGTTVTLSWTTSGANDVDITGVGTGLAANGSIEVTPGETTIYTLTANSACGTDTAEVTVTAQGAPAVNNFGAAPGTIHLGEAAELSWSVTDATSVTIDQSIGSVSAGGGTEVVYPGASTTYHLTAVNSCGETSAAANVTVDAPIAFAFQTGAGYLSPGSAFIECEFTYPVEGVVQSLTWSPDLPAGWNLIDATGGGNPSVQGAQVTFLGPFDGNPIQFVFEVTVPEGEDGVKEVGGHVEYLLEGMAYPGQIQTDPNILDLYELHDADFEEPYWVISGTELNRMLAYWRAGAYHCDASGSDGFAPASGSTDCESHSADYQPQEWVIDGTEVNRVLAYWRGGGYHLDPEGADGYAPGIMEADLQMSDLKQPDTYAAPTAIQTGPETFVPGGTCTITNKFSYSGSLLSLMWRPRLPKGWEITAVHGDGSLEMQGGEILWTGELPQSPVSMEYVVRVPEDETVTGQIYAEVEYQSAGESNSSILFLNAGIVLKHLDGDMPPLDINGMYESDAGSVRAIVQTYTTGSVIVMFIRDLTRRTVFPR